jgi:hypothetical protein
MLCGEVQVLHQSGGMGKAAVISDVLISQALIFCPVLKKYPL